LQEALLYLKKDNDDNGTIKIINDVPTGGGPSAPAQNNSETKIKLKNAFELYFNNVTNGNPMFPLPTADQVQRYNQIARPSKDAKEEDKKAYYNSLDPLLPVNWKNISFDKEYLEKNSAEETVVQAYIDSFFTDTESPGVCGKIKLLHSSGNVNFIPSIKIEYYEDLREAFQSERSKSKNQKLQLINLDDIDGGTIGPLFDFITNFRELNCSDPSTDPNCVTVTVVPQGKTQSEIKKNVKATIKATTNNDQSSRSHLFLIFEITFKSGKTGYITIIDAAGRESPLEMFKLYFNEKIFEEQKNPSFVFGSALTLPLPAIETFVKDQYVDNGKNLVKPVDIKKNDVTSKNTYPIDYALQITKEGVFINESINHMIYYFKKKQGNTEDPELNNYGKLYKNEKYFSSPKKEYKLMEEYKSSSNTPNTPYLSKAGDASEVIATYIPRQKLYGCEKPNLPLTRKNGIFVIPILDYLDNLNKTDKAEFKPTKFITIVCVRQEPDRCTDTDRTLQFADSVASTRS